MCPCSHPEVRRRLQILNTLLQPHELHFGYRVFDEIVLFLDAAERNELFVQLAHDAAPAFDAAVLMKVLPKFHGARAKLEAPLRSLLAWCVDPEVPADQAIGDELKDIDVAEDISEALSGLGYQLPKTAARAARMLRTVCVEGFAAFG